MKLWMLTILVVVMLSGCDEAIQLDLKQTPPRMVIEGQLTDVMGLQFVRVSKSQDFYLSGETQKISNATVTVTDNTGESIQFIHNPNGAEDSVGYYLPSKNYVGVIDRSYTLNVVVDGSTYTANDKLVRVTTIDSLGYQPNRFEVRDDPSDGKVWELLMYAKEPQETEDNYLFKFYRNDSLIYTNETDVYIFNDY